MSGIVRSFRHGAFIMALNSRGICAIGEKICVVNGGGIGRLGKVQIGREVGLMVGQGDAGIGRP